MELASRIVTCFEGSVEREMLRTQPLRVSVKLHRAGLSAERQAPHWGHFRREWTLTFGAGRSATVMETVLEAGNPMR